MGDARDGEVQMPRNGAAPQGVAVEWVAVDDRQAEWVDATRKSEKIERVRTEHQYVPLSDVVRSHVTTAEAAFYLNRKCQTLRIWRCHGKGPLQPVRVGKLLMWSVADIRSLLRVGRAA